MQHTLNLLKMKAEQAETVRYSLVSAEEEIIMNELIGKNISLVFTGEINCIHCGKKTKKSFGQGYCYPCFTSVPETSDCVLRPELCQAHLGISRDMNWSEGHCLQDHFVYLALTSGLKVGVTRSSQIPVRWIDQGAWKAVRLARTPNRYLAGCIEVELKKHLADKTNWRHMLTDKRAEHIDLTVEAERVKGILPPELRQYTFDEPQSWEFTYPVLSYPPKVNSLNLDKNPEIQGLLTGIRGQYLLFEGGTVINLRSHQGYRINLSYSS
ncbi:MAG: DUF2797 domain-containing protein [Bacteroidales bacterium]